MYYNGYGDHYDVTCFLHDVHDQISLEYFANRKQSSSASEKIEKCLNIIYNYGKKPMNLCTADYMVLNELDKQGIIGKIFNVKDGVYYNEKGKALSNQKAGTEFEEDVVKVIKTVFDNPEQKFYNYDKKGKKLSEYSNYHLGAARIIGDEMANEWIAEIKNNTEGIKKYIESRFSNSNNKLKKYKTEDLVTGFDIVLGFTYTTKGSFIAAKGIKDAEERVEVSKYRKAMMKDLEAFLKANAGKDIRDQYQLALTARYLPGSNIGSLKNKSANVALTKVDGKIDVLADGSLKTEFSVGADNSVVIQGLKEMEGHTFSLKVANEGNKIHIGGSNSIRAWFSILQGLGIKDKKTVVSSFIHANNLMLAALMGSKETRLLYQRDRRRKKSDILSAGQSKYTKYYEQYGNETAHWTRAERWDDARKNIYIIMFTYELTGRGLQYENDKVGTTLGNDFLIYLSLSEKDENPIKVLSVSQILERMFDSFGSGKGIKDLGSMYRQNPFTGEFSIDPAIFTRLDKN